MLKLDLKEFENNEKPQWEKESAYLVWNLQNLSKYLWRLAEKNVLIEDTKRRRICYCHVRRKAGKNVTYNIWQLIL